MLNSYICFINEYKNRENIMELNSWKFLVKTKKKSKKFLCVFVDLCTFMMFIVIIIYISWHMIFCFITYFNIL